MNLNPYDLKFGAGQRLIPVVAALNSEQMRLSARVLREAGCDAMMFSTGDMELASDVFAWLRRIEPGWQIGIRWTASNTFYAPDDVDVVFSARRVAVKPLSIWRLKESVARSRSWQLPHAVYFDYVRLGRSTPPTVAIERVQYASHGSNVVVVDSRLRGEPIDPELVAQLGAATGDGLLGLVGDVTPEEIEQHTTVRCFLPDTCLINPDTLVPESSKVKALLAALKH